MLTNKLCCTHAYSFNYPHPKRTVHYQIQINPKLLATLNLYPSSIDHKTYTVEEMQNAYDALLTLLDDSSLPDAHKDHLQIP